MFNKRSSIRIALLMLIAVFAVLQLAGCAGASKTMDLSVVFGDGTQKDYTIVTKEPRLGPALLAEGLIDGEEGEKGFELTSVAGGLASPLRNESWLIFKNGEELAESVDSIAISDGDEILIKLTSPMIEEGEQLANFCIDCA